MPRSWTKVSAGVALVALIGCTSDGASGPGPTVADIPARDVAGTVSLPGGTLISVSELTFASFSGTAVISEQGAFAGEVVAGSNPQIVAATSAIDGSPILLGYLAPGQSEIDLSVATTGLALVMLNPMLLGTPGSERARMANAVMQHPRFAELTSKLTASLQSQPATALDDAVNPATYQVAMEIGIAVLKSFGGQGRVAADFIAVDPPTVVNGPADEVTFVNPRTIHYCAGISNGMTARQPPDRMAIVAAKPSLVSVVLGWPPLVLTQPSETPYDIGRGQFSTRLESGTRMTVDRISSPLTSPETCGFAANALKGAFFVLDWLIGWNDEIILSTDGLARFTVTVGNVWQIGRAFAKGEPAEAFIELVQIVGQNAQSIGLYLTQEGFKHASSEFMATIGKVALGTAKVFQLVNAGNEQIPFVVDWIAAPPVVDYCFTKEGASFITCGSNVPPAPAFSVSPLAGDVTTLFTFDASATSDDFDAGATIQVRWDFDGDRVWDTPWTTAKTATRTYGARDAYTVFLEARDASGSSATAHRTVNVSGGFASGKHILIFRDVLPWQNVRIENLLVSHGFNPGPGVNQFEVLSSAQMSTKPLIPGESFVIIGNSQDQQFYDNYAANNVRFAKFVTDGGTMFWEACDLGWYNNNPNAAGGDLKRAGVIIPGNIATVAEFDPFNYVVDPTLPLMVGIPQIIQHNYASHESFIGLPEGTTVYMKNQADQPTLIEYKFGNGWVLATGQPIEHGYHLGADLGTLLPRVVAYVLGQSAALSALRAEPGPSNSVPYRSSAARGSPPN